MDVATKNLIRTFPGIDYLVARIPHRAAQEEFGDAMAIAKKCFRMPDGIFEMITLIGLFDGNRVEFRPGASGHLAGDLAFVVSRLIQEFAAVFEEAVRLPRS